MTLRSQLVRQTRAAMRAAAAAPMPFDGCASFHADIHLAVTGRDPMAPWRGRYTTRRGMQRVMGRRGLPGCMVQAARALGWRRVDPRRARPGDVGLIATPTGAAVVRQLDRGLWVGRAAHGWSVVRTADPAGRPVVRVAWSVA